MREHFEHQAFSKTFRLDYPAQRRLEQSPSPTGFHRIRRAFWQPWLYFELIHEIDSDAKYEFWYQYAFLNRLTEREIVELDYIYHHLIHQT